MMSDPTIESFQAGTNGRVPRQGATERRRSPLEHAAGWVATLHPGEGKTAARFAASACLLMVCYYVLKTLREPLLLVDGSAELKSYANAAIAAVLLVVVPLYGILYRRTDRHRLVRYVTLFFISTLLAFYAAGRAGVDVGFAYYVWVGAFGVLMPAQLWAHAASAYPPESGQRLFPLIMVGAAVGSLAGPKLASGLHSTLGAWNLMVLGAVLLTALLPLLERRDSSASPAAGDGPETRPRTSLLGGFALVLRDRYLLLLAAVAVLLNCVNSLGEFILADFVERDAAARIEAEPHLDASELIVHFYGDFHFTVNALTLIVQLFLVTRIFRCVGVQGALLVLPALAFVGYGLMAVVPVFAIVHLVKVLENSTDYSIMNTARHTLYLPLPTVHKYEGKTTVDTFFWRLGDMLQAGIVYVGLHVLGFGLSHFALVCVGLALVWLAVTLRLGDRYPIRAPRRIAVRRRTVTVGAATAVLAVTAFTLPLDDAGAGADGTQQPLFANHEPIAIVIEADLRSLCRGAGRECENVPATLIFTEEDGAERRVSGSIRARGKWRAEAANCSVPPLFVTILDTAAYAAVLGAHPPVLPLTTHCREKPSAYEQYVLKEYLAYRLYNALTDKSLRVRLARVTYRDSRRRGRAVERYALFVEHFDALAARLGGAVVPPAEVRPTDFDPQSLAMFELFEYMIGNTDWSVVAGHNVVHIREPDGTVTAVPFDFDFSGLVNASYALPPEQLPIRSVTQRLFRGACIGRPDWSRVFDEFGRLRAEAEHLIAETHGLDAKHRAGAERFLQRFFDALESPEAREKIIDRCRGR